MIDIHPGLRVSLSLLSTVFCCSTVLAQQHSSLWGSNGERWEAGGRLPDYSYAGYRSAEADIPEPAQVTDIRDFGAIADDQADDSAAIQAAIDATSNGAVLIPKGTFRLGRPIVVDKSNVVLRGVGDGADGSVLYVPESATERAGGIHDMRFSWGLAGFIILFRGATPSATAQSIAPATRADRVIRVADTSEFQAGGQLVINMQDDRLYGSLFSHLHNDRLTGWSQGTPQDWCGASDSWAFTIESVSTNTITLKEPLPFDIRSEWQPTAQTGRAITETGIENLRIQYRYAAPVPHLTERGFNGIRFERVRDSWIRNVTLEDVDNGITIGKQSSRNSLIDLVVEGRRGHHATTITMGSSYNLIDGIELKTDDGDGEWIHAFTIDHAAQGNVVQQARSNKVMKLDLHRDSPFENLYTEILTESNLKGSGDWCAGPHTGARLTLWNAAGLTQGIESDLLKGVDSQVNIITSTDRPNVSSDDGLWVENIQNIQPRNLYQAQLARRLGRDDPDVTVSLSASSVIESAAIANVVAQLSAVSTAEVVIGVNTRPISARNGQDFYGLSRRFSIAPGTRQINIPVSLIDDSVRENTERFEVRLYSVDGAKPGNSVAQVTIEDDDTTSLPEISIEDGRVVEGEDHSMRLTLNSPSQTGINVSVATKPVSARNGQDYYGVYETLRIEPGQTEVLVPVTILDDTAAESIENFTQAIFNVSGAVIKRGQATTTIVDND